MKMKKEEIRAKYNEEVVGIVNPPSLAQVEFYYNQAGYKGVTPIPMGTLLRMSKKAIWDENERLKAIAGPASEAQINLIKTKIEILRSYGEEIGTPSDEALSRLTGGQEGSASRLINALMAKEASWKGREPITEKQAEVIAKFFPCPDVPYEEIGIDIRIDLGDGLWRRITRDEIKTKLMNDKVLKSDASKFIDAYRGAVHTWRETRASQGKRTHIRELEARMANISSPREVQISIDMEGNIIETLLGDTEAYQAAYTPIDEVVLELFSEEEADKYIDQLKAELSTRFGTSLEDTVDKKELKNLEDAMYSLFMLAGYEDEDMINTVVTNDRVLNMEKFMDFINFNIEKGAFTLEMVITIIGEEMAESIGLTSPGEEKVKEKNDEIDALIMALA